MFKVALDEKENSLEYLYAASLPAGSKRETFDEKGELSLITLAQALGDSTYQVTLKNKILDLSEEEIRFTEPPRRVRYLCQRMLI
ncbi:MAG: hypothetical protein PHZ16_05260 [Eubacteriales bacterium]|jgi:hypothetical protein|nr:hypothetical protein [Eubacteriales bacterium]MDD3610779.1 hypothetical protein [Eubacteriales bacterium]